MLCKDVFVIVHTPFKQIQDFREEVKLCVYLLHSATGTCPMLVPLMTPQILIL